jgi:hypothetical protein
MSCFLDLYYILSYELHEYKVKYFTTLAASRNFLQNSWPLDNRLTTSYKFTSYKLQVYKTAV